jgi:hypothetical protein
MASKKDSLVSAAMKLAAKAQKTFYDKLPTVAQSELAELRRALHAGELPSHITGKALFDLAAQRYGKFTSVDTFRRWLRD